MRKPLFYGIFLLSCIFISCEKKSIRPQQNSSFNEGYRSSSVKEIELMSGEKSITFPDFDLTRPVYSESENLTVTTYFERGYVAGSQNYWTFHDFEFGNESLQLNYHFVVHEGVVISDVYDVNRIYQFTYTDNHGDVSIGYDNPQDPQQIPPGFFDCMRWYINNYDTETIIVGAPCYAYYAYRCYKRMAK